MFYISLPTSGFHSFCLSLPRMIQWINFTHDTVSGFPRSLSGKEIACNAGDSSLIPGLGRSPIERNGNPLQYSCLGNAMDRGACQSTAHGPQNIGHDWATEYTHTHTHDAGPIALPQVHSPSFLPKLSLQQQLHFQWFSIIFKLLTLWKYAFIVYIMSDIQKCFLNGVVQTDFSDGSVDKNPPANAGDEGSDPGQ